MTQIKKKTVICKSVIIATVVAIRDVVKNGFHCSHILNDPCDVNLKKYFNCVTLWLSPVRHTI